jgi:hypothetical protein
MTPPAGRSGRLDLNQRPPVPQTGALTRLRHAPNRLHYERPTRQSSTMRASSTKPCFNFFSISIFTSGGGTGTGAPSS